MKYNFVQEIASTLRFNTEAEAKAAYHQLRNQLESALPPVWKGPFKTKIDLRLCLETPSLRSEFTTGRIVAAGDFDYVLGAFKAAVESAISPYSNGTGEFGRLTVEVKSWSEERDESVWSGKSIRWRLIAPRWRAFFRGR